MSRHRLLEPRAIATISAAVAGAAIAGLQLRHGVLQILDTASYESGAAAFRSGHPLTSTLAPSFSAFSAADFAARDGRVPFVDFPLGYPLLAGLIGLVSGARRALGVLGVFGTAAIVALVVAGARAPRHVAGYWTRGVLAALIVVMPTYRLVVQGGLSEPVFCAAALALAVTLVRARDGHSLRPAVAVGSVLGLLRFVGAPLAVLPAIEHYRRRRSPLSALGIAALGVAPAALNIAWAAAAGGGHTAKWHGIQRLDVRLFVRSITGWFHSGYGNLAKTLLRVGDEFPPWGLALVALWTIAVVWAGWSWLVPEHRRAMPEQPAVALTMAGLLSVALFAGLASFDALATPDNRITLPIGVLTIAAAAWWIDARSQAGLAVAAAVAMTWFLTAAAPTEVRGVFTDGDRQSAAIALRAIPARLIVSNAADDVYWHTHKPSAYLPPDVSALTGESVDQRGEFDRLPCALRAHDGIIAVFKGAFFGVSPAQQTELDRLVAAGRLTADTGDAAVTLYRPGGALECG